jgi:uncharacterized protein
MVTPEKGKWAAEDAHWSNRVKEKVFYLWPRKSLLPTQPIGQDKCVSSNHFVLDTKMLETSSWGLCGNNDLPGNQAEPDSKSIYFDSAPLDDDMDCFGPPTVSLNLACDRPLASIAVRLCEVSPATNASHLVSYRFFNLCYRGGSMSAPEHIKPESIFNVRIPLNVIGHTFKRGWRVRLSVSPSFFPTLWESPQKSTITLYTGPIVDSPASSLSLPGRKPRPEDARLKMLLPPDPEILCIDSEPYVPTCVERKGKNTRQVKHITIGSKTGVPVEEVFDSGRNRYGGPLEDLVVDQVAAENFRIFYDEPMSLVGFTKSRSILERTKDGEVWKVLCKTTTRVWTEKNATGQVFFRYKATMATFIGKKSGGYEPFERKTVDGLIPRLWV